MINHIPVVIAIPLTKGYTAIVDEQDADLGNLKWHACGIDPYAARHNDGKYDYLHRIVLARILGHPLGRHEEVDHIDLNHMNNQRSNLRLSTNAENVRNVAKRSTNSSGFKGVSYDKSHSKWRAQISIGKKHKHLGYFATAEQAHEAYKAGASKFHGSFARFE